MKEQVEEVKTLIDRLHDLARLLTEGEKDEIDTYLNEKYPDTGIVVSDAH